MLREIAEALEALTTEKPLVFAIEDLHGSDSSTLALLASLARRREPARLLVLGTYRPVEVLVGDHPLRGVKQELQLHDQCEEVVLDFLPEEAVKEYLTTRFSGHQFPPHLHQVIHHRTDGNPLFMVNVTNYLVSQGVIAMADGRWELKGDPGDLDVGVPESLRQLIEQQLHRLSSEERETLEAASVAGPEFSAAAVAAGADSTVEETEQRCDALVRQEQFLQARGTAEWPDGIIAARYAFIHALYQEVLYARVQGARRVRLHQQIGEKEETAYGSAARKIAAELAVHFERSRDTWRAVRYLEYAGQNALRRSAHQEAIHQFTKGLTLLRLLPDTPRRMQQELSLQKALGSPLAAVQGYAAPEVEQVYNRRTNCVSRSETPRSSFPCYGGCVSSTTCGESSDGRVSWENSCCTWRNNDKTLSSR